MREQTRNRFIMGLIALLIVINIATISSLLLLLKRLPASHPSFPPTPPARMEARFTQDLYLEEHQCAPIFRLLHDLQKRVAPLVEARMIRQRHLFEKTLLATTPPGPEEIQAMIKDLLHEERALHQEIYQHLLELRTILNPRQASRFADLFQQIRGGFPPPGQGVRPPFPSNAPIKPPQSEAYPPPPHDIPPDYPRPDVKDHENSTGGLP